MATRVSQGKICKLFFPATKLLLVLKPLILATPRLNSANDRMKALLTLEVSAACHTLVATAGAEPVRPTNHS